MRLLAPPATSAPTFEDVIANTLRHAVREEMQPLLARLDALARNTPSADNLALLSAEQVGELLCVKPATVRQWARRGLLLPVDLGEPGHRQTLRFRRSEVERFVAARQRKPNERVAQLLANATRRPPVDT